MLIFGMRQQLAVFHQLETCRKYFTLDYFGVDAVQAVGSTISYGKRYGIGALLNISTGDDTDGHLPPPNEPDITDWLIAIRDCTSIGELQKVFTEAYTPNKAHKGNAKRLTAAKDAKKKELSNG
jgi:hypothetical protein